MKNSATTLLLFLSSFIIFPCLSSAQTTISGGEVGGVWTLANSPYIIESTIRVYRDSFLTIEPGVEVRFDDNVTLNVFINSTLTAIGTPQAPIVFTSNATNPAPGDWSRINNSGNGMGSTFKHCIIEYADFGLFCYGWASGCNSGANRSIIDSCEIRYCNTGIYCSGAGSSTSGCIPISRTGSSSPTITWNSIHHNTSRGIYLAAWDGYFANGFVGASISRNIIEYNGDNGIECWGDDPVNPKIFNNLIQHNANAALKFRNNSSPDHFEVYNNIMIHNQVGIQSDSSFVPKMRNNNIWNNTLNYQGITQDSSSISQDPLFVDATNQDFHLLCASPCINAGDPASPPDPDGSIADMGVYWSPGPPIAIISGDSTLCEGENLTLTASGGNSYQWNTGETGIQITVSPHRDTSYSVTVADSSSCLDTAYIQIQVSPPPVASIRGDSSICQGEGTLLTASGGRGFVWNNGQTASQIYVSPDQSSDFSVVVENDAACTDTAIARITVHELPIAEIVGDNSFCMGDSAELSTPGIFSSYIWSNGASSPVISVFASGTFVLTVMDDFGCTSIPSDSFLVEEISQPDRPEVVRSTSQADLLESNLTGNMYQWYLDGNLIAGEDQKTFSPPQSGNYQVQIWQENCPSELSEVYRFYATAIDGDLISKGIKLFPNPAKHTIQLEGTVQQGQVLVEIYNFNGQKVLTKSPLIYQGALNTRLDLRTLATGTYWLQLKIGDRYLGQRFMKME